MGESYSWCTTVEVIQVLIEGVAVKLYCDNLLDR